MRKIGVTLALAFAASLGGFLFVVTLVYGCTYWLAHSLQYRGHAGAYLFIYMEMFVGLPGGVLTGLGCAFIVLVWRLARPRPG
ncbi:MAG: hypothetical protein DMF53_14315 [Acidobacteria bacterium]|nr:MAG: hypothetical protein DMF53_14315 [Acidobacteriota bacterium]